jgi:hypothetical protein
VGTGAGLGGNDDGAGGQSTFAAVVGVHSKKAKTVKA